jgi:hypothetical protein
MVLEQYLYNLFFPLLLAPFYFFYFILFPLFYLFIYLLLLLLLVFFPWVLLKKGGDTFSTHEKWSMFIKNHSKEFHNFLGKIYLNNKIMVHLLNVWEYHYPLFT